MTEIPEHLLNRSRQRRSALGLGGGEGGDAPAAPAAPAAADAPAAPAATPAPRAAAPVPAPEAPPPPPPPPPYVEAALRRPRVPKWAVPVLVALPVWGFLYAGTMTEPPAGEDDPLVMGATLYSEQCAACHGGRGAGGVGPQLSGGEVELTFPDPVAHFEWVVGGSENVGIGNGYGAEDRPGGQRIANGGMPAFGETLTPEEIVNVVRYEREVLSDAAAWEDAEAFLADPAAATVEGGGEQGGTGTGNVGGQQAPSTGQTRDDTSGAQSEGGNVGGLGGTAGGQRSTQGQGTQGIQGGPGDSSEEPGNVGAQEGNTAGRGLVR